MPETVPYRTEIGYEYPVFDIVVSQAEQRRLHGIAISRRLSTATMSTRPSWRGTLSC